MTWFKVDDRFPTHRKVMGLPRGQRRVAAVGAWTLLGAWCAANGTEGHVSTALVEEFGIPSRPISDLIGAGLLEHADGGYVLHDYLDYNPTAEQVAADRIAARERQRRARERARESRTAREDRHAVTNGVSHGPVTPGVTVPPTRPVLKEQNTGSASPDPTPQTLDQRRPENRPDVERICDLMARSVEYRGAKRPTITGTWRREARLLLDRDDRDPAEIEYLIRWVADHSFWRRNVLSVPKLREQYDRLLIEARQERAERANPKGRDPTRRARSEDPVSIDELLRRVP